MNTQLHARRIDAYLEELNKGGFTTQPVIAGNCADVLAECGRWQDVQRLFGIKRGLLYLLFAEGQVKSVLLRRKGNVKDCRLFYLQSVSEFFHKLLDEQNAPTPGNSTAAEPRREGERET